MSFRIGKFLCSFGTVEDFSGKHPAILQLICKDYSHITSTNKNIASYSFIGLTAPDSNPGSLR